MDDFRTRHDNNQPFPIIPTHPAIVSARDVQEKQPSSTILKKHAKNLLEGAKKIKQQRKEARRKKLEDLTQRITIITNGDSSQNQKIESLQRMLNNHSKEMDASMVDRIKRELVQLHEKTDKAEEIKKESEQNNAEPKKIDVPFVNQMKGTEPKVFGHDYQTDEEILEDGTRRKIDENDDKPLPVEVQIARETIKHQVKKDG